VKTSYLLLPGEIARQCAIVVLVETEAILTSVSKSPVDITEDYSCFPCHRACVGANLHVN
jgi:hypothetical protein